MIVQLWALGRSATKSELNARGLPFVSASNIPEYSIDFSVPRVLTKEEIKQYINTYAVAAKNAVKTGANGVEIHTANGYLLDQLLYENTNNRTDEYSGSIKNRARFSLGVVDAITEVIGGDKVAIRFSPWGIFFFFGEMDNGAFLIPQFFYAVSELQKCALAGKELALPLARI